MIELNIDLAANVAEEIAAIEDQLFGNNLQVIYGMDKKINVLYATDNRQMVGFLSFKRNERNIEIYNFGIISEYRRQYLGTKMLDTFQAFNCSLEVRETNESAINFYLNNGFFKSFVRKNYYGAEHAIVLERMMKMTENAYAKINLVLNVISKEENGYHQIEFLMNSVDLHDVVTVEKSDSDQVIVADNPDLSNLDNLVYKALSVMREEFQFKTMYKITIEKNIPVAAGMAGGSSDAAAVMRIINKLEQLDLTESQLAKLAAQVGSDVSYCIYSRLAIATGFGEKIELVENTIPTKYLLIINPGVPLSTANVYNNHQINDIRGDIQAVLAAKTNEQFELAMENSLAITAKQLCPQMTLLEDELKCLTSHRIFVSGSGPTLLIFSSDKLEIEQLYAELKPKYEQVYIAKMN